MQKNKISIITVVYNAKEALEKTVQSIQNQTYKKIEHVIVDGASSDGTVEYLQVLSNIKYISEKDNGIYDAMNKGITLSDGEYILFLNAGDSFSSDTILEEIANKLKDMESRPKIIYGGVNVHSKEGKFLTVLKPLEFTKDNLNKYATRTVCHQAIFVHRDSIKMYSDKYRLKGELNWYYELVDTIKSNEILKVNNTICDYYLGGTGDINFMENYFERIKVAKEHNDSLKFISLIPFFLIPLIFRIRRVIFGK